jgi:hypothetical protein
LTGGKTGTPGYTAADAEPLKPTSAAIATTLATRGRRRALRSMKLPAFD